MLKLVLILWCRETLTSSHTASRLTSIGWTFCTRKITSTSNSIHRNSLLKSWIKWTNKLTIIREKWLLSLTHILKWLQVTSFTKMDLPLRRMILVQHRYLCETAIMLFLKAIVGPELHHGLIILMKTLNSTGRDSINMTASKVRRRCTHFGMTWTSPRFSEQSSKLYHYNLNTC